MTMDYHWQDYIARRGRRKDSHARITLSHQGRLRLTRAAVEMLGSPTWVSVMYDKEQCAISLRTARDGDATIRKLTSWVNESQFQITVKGLPAALGLSSDSLPLAGTPFMLGDRMVVCLAEAVAKETRTANTPNNPDPTAPRRVG